MSSDFGITHVQTTGDWKHRGDYPAYQVPAGVEPQIIVSENFSNFTLPTTGPLSFIEVTEFGDLSIVADPSELGAGMVGAIRGDYPQQDGTNGNYHVMGTYNVGEHTDYDSNDIYIEFKAKMPGVKHGLKFLKLFGERDPEDTQNYGNCTLHSDYTGLDNGGIPGMFYGDGTIIENDVQQVARFDSSEQFPSRAAGLPGYSIEAPQGKWFESSDWGTDWHHFKVYAKFNSGTTEETETNDGQFIVYIDDELYLDAQGLFNRHYNNRPLEKIRFFGWTQGVSPAPLSVYYTDIIISKNGWVS